jgi:hypothetical protein
LLLALQEACVVDPYHVVTMIFLYIKKQFDVSTLGAVGA